MAQLVAALACAHVCLNHIGHLLLTALCDVQYMDVNVMGEWGLLKHYTGSGCNHYTRVITVEVAHACWNLANPCC